MVARRLKWWNRPIESGNLGLLRVTSVIVFGIVVEIMSSPMARIWFGLVIVGSVLVAIFLRWRRARDLETRSYGGVPRLRRSPRLEHPAQEGPTPRGMGATRQSPLQKAGATQSFIPRPYGLG